MSGGRLRGGDAVAGAVLLAVALAVAGLALGFRVAFAADPLGPRALPLLAAVLMGAAGVALALRPGDAWPMPDGGASRRIAWAVAVFLAYVPLLPWAGFVPATALLVAGLGRLFGGPPWKVLVSGVGVAVALHLLFTAALGLALPAGAWAGGP